jgi:acyl-CoA synthetase (NDP forming)
MKKIFTPESIAVVGLSSKDSNIPRLTLENMLRWGYRGRVSHLLHTFPQVRELDINPMRVFSKGAMALDARMRVA